MNPSVNIISTLSRTEDETGSVHFAGTIDVAALRKTKASRIDVILIPMASIPQSLSTLMARNEVQQDGLVMFAGGPIQDEKTGRGGHGK